MDDDELFQPGMPQVTNDYNDATNNTFLQDIEKLKLK